MATIHKTQDARCVAIDLGTTNSLIASASVVNGKIKTPVRKVKRQVDGRNGSRTAELLPSVVCYPPDGSRCIVGDYAKQLAAVLPSRVVRSVKSQMGQPVLEGTDSTVPDKTPEEVSARIVRHLLVDYGRQYGGETKDAVITVPASFDPAQRLATLRAAELAGLEVKDENGKYDETMLLSEPEAVMYNILNEIRNGDYDAVLSFDEPKTVLVYDIGGGTLDITLHTVSKNRDNPDLLEMTLLATNRYTPVAGDTFDRYIAETMWKQLSATHGGNPAELKQKKEQLMAVNLIAFAEQLKFDINQQVEDAAYDNTDLSDDFGIECGGALVNGYNYDGYITKREFEESVRPLMGFNYTYSDYKTIGNKAQTADIIWPVLDVLRKGAKKLGTDDMKVDSVIMSGGMSKLYLIRKRLEDFFGFHVYSVSDPDEAVVQGAVVYHYNLHRDSEVMQKIHANAAAEAASFTGISAVPATATAETVVPFVRSNGAVQNDTLYLGLRGGVNHPLIDEGEQLPFKSEIMHDFRIEKGQKRICVPIRKKSTRAGEYVTIASGVIDFRTAPTEDRPVSVCFSVNRDMTLRLEAWMCQDDAVHTVIEKGETSLSLKREDKVAFTPGGARTTAKLTPPAGSTLIAANEVRELCGMISCRPTDKSATTRIANKKKTITSCANPQDFAVPMLKAIHTNSWNSFILRVLFPLARRLAGYWKEEERTELIRECMSAVSSAFQGFVKKDLAWTDVYNEVFHTVAVYGTDKDVAKFECDFLMKTSVYRDALVKAFALHGLRPDWIAEQLSIKNGIAYRWIGLAVSRFSAPFKVDKVFDRLCGVFEQYTDGYNGQCNQISNAAISLGLICDRRSETSCHASESQCKRAENLLAGMLDYCVNEDVPYASSMITPLTVSLRMVRGETLNISEEQYLLSLWEETPA